MPIMARHDASNFRRQVLGTLAAVAVVAGCTTTVQQRPATVSPVSAAAPAAVAAAFMQAVADSNLPQMGELWGTSKGSAAATNTPANWVQRVGVIQAYLRGGTHRIIGENIAGAKDGRREIMVELTRGSCVKNVPFTMVLTKQGAWVVNSIDLNAAGVPGRPCQNSSSGTSG